MTPRVLTLREYQRHTLAPEELTVSEGQLLWERYRHMFEVDFPTPKTGGLWSLKSTGWAGYLPLSPELGLSLLPKAPLRSIFQMLEYAYNLRSFHVLEDLFACETLEDFASRLAQLLALRVLRRARRGLYRAYLTHEERLPYVAGRLDLRPLLRAPWPTTFHCTTEEHTADIEDNQILLWTLWTMARSPIGVGPAGRTVRAAYQSLHGLCQLRPFRAADCVGRRYHRLNDDYRLLHALCRFFLAHSTPAHQVGDQQMLPFLVDMAKLFELFVREWLRVHLADVWDLKWQEHIPLSADRTRELRLDLVLRHHQTGRVVAVLDTKYKVPTAAGEDDIYQMVAYATATRCHEAFLIYPTSLAEPLDIRLGDVRVRSLVFALEGELEAAGTHMLTELFAGPGLQAMLTA